MGHTHTVFLVLSALAFSILFFDPSTSSGDTVQVVEIGLMLMAPVLLTSLLFHGSPGRQAGVLKIVRILIVLLLILYYYLLWNAGALRGWSDQDGQSLESILFRFSPMLGYIFLTLSVRVLAQNLKRLRQMDRLRG